MVKHPFGSSIKKYISAIDAALDIENIDSTALLAANDVKEIISTAMYDAIIDAKTNTPSTNSEEWAEVLERLCYAMAPLTLYHHFIWLQLRVSNSGITTMKGQNETTAFKYQTDEGKESLLNFYAAWTKELIDYLEEKKSIFTQWNSCTQRTETQALLIKDYREFDKIYNGEGNAAFFYRSRSIQKEIQDELVPHIGAIAETTPAATLTKLKRALVYLTLSRCIVEWDYMYIPAPVKRAINNEMSLKSGSEVQNVKERVSAKFKNIAESSINTIDLKNNADKQEADNPDDDIVITPVLASATDKHVLMM